MSAEDDAAHALAERFSHASDDASQAARAGEEAARKALEHKLEQEERLRADEAEMLARAKAEAAEREATAKREAEEKATAALRVLEAQRAVEEARKREEDRLAAAAEEAARKAEEQRLAEQKAEADRREREAVEVKARDDAERKALEAAREAETRQLSEKLTRAREKREAEKAAAEGYSALGNPPPAATVSLTEPKAAADPTKVVATQDLRGTLADRETRATVLLMMEPGNRGIRRYQKSADPVLCVGQTCYISNGPEQAATRMPRGRAFGPGQTLGQRAGACRQSLACVFRGIDLGAQRVVMQPVDLRILRHDRRETSTAAIDATCAAVPGHLSCSGGVASASYRLWVVPESVAETAGVSALRAALAGKLRTSDAAQLGR